MDELFLQCKNLRKPETLEEMNQQLGLICDAIEKCQKMMQHLAVGALDGTDSGSELNKIMSQQMQLMRMREELTTARDDTLQSASAETSLTSRKEGPYSGWFASIIRGLGRKK